MTGTAMTEATEFYKVYGLDVIAIPTNCSLVRLNHSDVIFRYEREKLQAILDEIKEVNASGRPILVGTTSIEKSEELAEMLKRFGIPHQVLNAKYHEREAEIVAQAGRREAVTIATNMAGRGTDIILGGNPEFMAWADLKRMTDEDGRPLYPTRLEVPKDVWEQAVARYEPEMRAQGREVATVGGLHIIGTERHESRRIDNQLRGRAGRQGDPGSSRFFLSLEDDLMRKFAGEWVSAVLTRLGMQEGEAIESKMVSRRIEGAQKKVEERNFDIRKNLLEYDEVMDEQRKRVYSFRQSLLEGAPPKETLIEMIDNQIDDAAKRFLADDYGAASFAESVGQRLGVELTAREIKGASFEDAEEIAKTKAERHLRETIRQAMDENLPGDADPSDWTWQALANWANARFELNLKDRDLKKLASSSDDEFQFGHADLEEFLNEQAVQSLAKIDLKEAREFLLPDWGRRSFSGWVHHKFATIIDPASWADLDRAEIVRRVRAVARVIYAQKEAELPTRIALVKYLGDRSQHQNPRYDREGLAAWASSRYHTEIKEDELRPLLRPEIEERLIGLAHQNYQGARLFDELEAKLAAIKPTGSGPDKNGTPADPHALADLAAWARQSLQLELTEDNLHSMSTAEIRRTVLNALDAKERPEMREMEKAVLLQILDSSWMEHLRAMDHLRSSIGLQGYAQIDPKVEYKREGMRIFAEMWNGIGDRVTDLIFRVEQFDPEFLTYLGSQWKLDRAQTIHQQADSQLAPSAAPNGVRNQQDAAVAGSQRSPEKKREPVRNVAKKVGRNDPCPCGSGKKFKACHMRKQSAGDPF
jgi:preprotein translocase subunit SecA